VRKSCNARWRPRLCPAAAADFDTSESAGRFPDLHRPRWTQAAATHSQDCDRHAHPALGTGAASANQWLTSPRYRLPAGCGVAHGPIGTLQAHQPTVRLLGVRYGVPRDQREAEFRGYQNKRRLAGRDARLV
jgi:hypothetical protein